MATKKTVQSVEPDIADFAKRLIYIVDGVVHYDGPVSEFKGKR